jgi:DNA adenine methylase
MVFQGSKARLVGWLLPLLKPYLERASFYYEPFMGGANLLCKVPHKKRIGSDVNPYLVALLSKVRDDPSCLPYTVLEEEFSRVLKNPGDFPKWYVGMVAFCATYNGIYRGSYARGERNYIVLMLDNLRNQAPFLKGIDFRCSDFRKVNFGLFPKGGLILADIPYRGTTGYRYRFDHDEFYRWCRYVHGLGHTILLTEFWAPSCFVELASVERHNFMSGPSPGAVVSTVIERLFLFRG